jgi:type VI secretion system secreted protein Hcp
MAVDAFLQFTETGATGVVLNGETRDKEMGQKTPVPFEIQDWKFAVSNIPNIGSASGGAGAGKAKFEPFTVKKTIDTSSPQCFFTCCVGGHFKLVKLFVRKAGGTATQSGTTYLQFDYKLVAVSAISWSNGDVPTEDITFEYGALKFKYVPQDSTGKLGTPIETQWDQITNQADFDAGFGAS